MKEAQKLLQLSNMHEVRGCGASRARSIRWKGVIKRESSVYWLSDFPDIFEDKVPVERSRRPKRKRTHSPLNYLHKSSECFLQVRKELERNLK